MLDDLIVTGRDDGEHLDNLREVFKRCKEAGFQLNKDKCQFFKTQVEYLGHVIDKDGLRTSENKVSCISKIPVPKKLVN